MNDKNLILALNRQERFKILSKTSHKLAINLDEIYNQWIARRSLVKEKEMEQILLFNNLSKEEFAVGISPIDELAIARLYNELKKQSWYQLHRNILTSIKEIGEEVSFEIYVRPYVQWMQSKLNSFCQKIDINIHDNVIKNVLSSFEREIVTISLKTLVYDMNEWMEDKSMGITQDNYFIKRFRNYDAYQSFYNDYPVLARLLATRSAFFLENMSSFINAISETSSDEWEMLQISQPLNLTEITMDKGDSHEKGKSAILMTINEKKLVFKYKDLTVANSFANFCQLLEKLNSNFSFYDIKRIVKKEYTIEEFVRHVPCKNNEEVKLFYKRFGHLIALTYFLRGSDFHLENLIAAGSYPVLIDLETLIQNTGNREDNLTASFQCIKDFQDSIMGTSLLPRYSKQIGKSIELSALNGDEQLLPEKVLQLVEKENGCLCMEYQEGIMEGSNNLPVLEGEKLDWQGYKNEIIAGFSEMYQFFLSNKLVLTKHISQEFSSVVVRNVLKATQNYAELLDFSYHPSCMTNYLHILYQSRIFFADDG